MLLQIEFQHVWNIDIKTESNIFASTKASKVNRYLLNIDNIYIDFGTNRLSFERKSTVECKFLLKALIRVWGITIATD